MSDKICVAYVAAANNKDFEKEKAKLAACGYHSHGERNRIGQNIVQMMVKKCTPDEYEDVIVPSER